MAGEAYDARACHERALSLQPDYAAAWLGLGAAGGGRVAGDAYDARASLERSLSLKPAISATWDSLRLVGGGTVDGSFYDEKDCERRVFESANIGAPDFV